MKWTPDKYMLDGVRFLVERACAGLFWDPGLCKTSVVLAAITTFLSTKVARGVLVLCPLRVAYGVWPKEVKKWDDFQHLSVGVLHGSGKDAVFDAEHDIYVINFEGLDWLYDRLRGLRAKDWPFDVLVVDESSKIKNMRTGRYKLLKPLLRFFRRRYILTGSPAPKNLLDVFGQVYAMDMGATLGRYFTDYRDEYFYPTGYGGYQWKLKPGSDKRIYKTLAPRVLRADEKDHMKIPGQNPHEHPRDIDVELPPKARKLYEEMEEEFRILVDGTKINAVNSGVAHMKCRQISGGAIFDGPPGKKHTWKTIHDAKLDALEGLVDELEGQGCMIIYEFEHERERIRKLFPDAVVATGLSPKRALEVEDAWNRNEIDKLLVQPQSMSHGLNLQQGGRAQIWYTLPNDYDVYDQTIRRMYRRGRKSPVYLYRLIANDTVDEAVRDSLSFKGRRQDAFLFALRNYWKRRSV